MEKDYIGIVRNNIPNIMVKSGSAVSFRQAKNKEERLQALKEKLKSTILGYCNCNADKELTTEFFAQIEDLLDAIKVFCFDSIIMDIDICKIKRETETIYGNYSNGFLITEIKEEEQIDD